MTEQEKQWRESIYKNGLKDYDYLLNLSISFREYSGANDDHVHCELCWDKISMHESDLHCGYVSHDQKIWLCPDCVKSFKQLFHWKITNEQ